MDLACQCETQGFPVHFAQFDVAASTSPPGAFTVSNVAAVVLPGGDPS